jgi:phosphate transport system protein
MATPALKPEVVEQEVLVNYLISMARTVEGTVNRSLDALIGLGDPRTGSLPSEIFMLEPRINEMEMIIDEYAVRLLRKANLPEEDIRLTVASLKITKDLERMGDLGVNLAERVISLNQMLPVTAPKELAPMVAAARAMVSRALGALIFRNVILATGVLESDDFVDGYRDRVFEHLMIQMTKDAGEIAPSTQFILATRHLERIADHATNIAEEIIFWIRGLDVRHGHVPPSSGGDTRNGSGAEDTGNVAGNLPPLDFTLTSRE